MNADELHQHLQIPTPFSEWAAALIKAGKPLEPLPGFIKRADGKLGRNYRVPPGLLAELLGAAQPDSLLVKVSIQNGFAEPDTRTNPDKNALVRVQAAAQAEPDKPMSVKAFNQAFLNRELTDKQARKAGINLVRMAKNKRIALETEPDAVWGSVNLYPLHLLTKYYCTPKPAKKPKPSPNATQHNDFKAQKKEATC
jgi:hypothetical protein